MYFYFYLIKKIIIVFNILKIKIFNIYKSYKINNYFFLNENKYILQLKEAIFSGLALSFSLVSNLNLWLIHPQEKQN